MDIAKISHTCHAAKARRFYAGLHQHELKDERRWIEKQVYIALGAGALEIDACPLEGFDVAILDTEPGLAEQGLTATVLVTLDYHSDEDCNARLPKSRLPEVALITEI